MNLSDPPTAMAPLQQFDHLIDIQPEDVRGGHVNNARYFVYIDIAFQAWYEAMGIQYQPDKLQVQLMAHSALDFLREMSYPGQVLCRLTVTRLGRSSLEHRTELRDAAEPEVIYARGRAVHVWFDRERGQAAAWPPELMALCWAPGAA